MNRSFRSKEIAVVCNSTMSLNHGMASEHLALHSLATRNGYTNLRYYELLSRDEHMAALTKSSPPSVDARAIAKLDREFSERIPIAYERLLGSLDKVIRSDAIIFWCSWLHSPLFYDYNKHLLLQLSLASSERQAADIIDSHIYLMGQPDEVLTKSLSFGQNFLFNSRWHENRSDYGAAYKSFYTRVRRARMRDVLSSRRISRLRSDPLDSNTFVDCATLLKQQDVDKLCRLSTHDEIAFCRHKIGVFFGRSDVAADSVRYISEFFSESLGAPVFSLPWGFSYSFPQTKALPFPCPVPKGRSFSTVGDSLSMIREARAIISDTYHVCVNAWTMGVPAICIGGDFSKRELDMNSGFRFLNFDKRHLLYALIYALDFYVHEEELHDLQFLKAHLEHIVKLIDTPGYVRSITDDLLKEASEAEAQFVRALDEILLGNQDA